MLCRQRGTVKTISLASIRRTRQMAVRSDRIHAVYHGMPLPGSDESGDYDRVRRMLTPSAPQPLASQCLAAAPSPPLVHRSGNLVFWSLMRP